VCADPQAGLQRRSNGVQHDCKQNGAKQQEQYVGQRPHCDNQCANADDNENATDEGEVGCVWTGHGAFKAFRLLADVRCHPDRL
jgi:hypothetical protein